MQVGECNMTSLFEKYIESREFVSSLTSMAALLEESLTADFDQEPNPLRTISLVVYTCTRLWDSRPIGRMVQLARHYSNSAVTELDRFRLQYSLVAGGAETASSLVTYLSMPGIDGFRNSARTASLAYYLKDESLLYSCVDAIREYLMQQPILDADLEWELEFAEAMYSALKCGRADLVQLCRTASRIDSNDHLSFVSTDVNILQRSLRTSGGNGSGAR